MSWIPGKIKKVTFGLGGYQGEHIGLHLEFDIAGGGSVGTSIAGGWDPATIKCSEHANWTEKERDEDMAKMLRQVSKVLKDAKVRSVDQLPNKPVLLKFGSGEDVQLDGIVAIGASLIDWRIFTEVL